MTNDITKINSLGAIVVFLKENTFGEVVIMLFSEVYFDVYQVYNTTFTTVLEYCISYLCEQEFF